MKFFEDSTLHFLLKDPNCLALFQSTLVSEHKNTFLGHLATLINVLAILIERVSTRYGLYFKNFLRASPFEAVSLTDSGGGGEAFKELKSNLYLLNRRL